MSSAEVKKEVAHQRRRTQFPLGERPRSRSAAGAPPAHERSERSSIEPGGLELKHGATLTVQNTGAVPHNLTSGAAEPSERLAGTSTFVRGEAERLRVDLRPGRYALVCTVGDHRGRGMVGSLTVR
jgi:plastocyanin